MTTRIQLASDLHLEHLARSFPRERTLEPAPEADLLVLAGDISQGLRAIGMFADWPVPVFYVAGNHEFYGESWESTRRDLDRLSRGTQVHVLDDAICDFNGVRFMGTTLWTDYLLDTGHSQLEHMALAQISIADHRFIRTDQGPFPVERALSEHRLSRSWLARELDTPFDGHTVVISHHGPHPRSVHARFRRPETLALNAAFVSDLTPLLAKADLWLHGHVHNSFDYRVCGCRVVANPRGYPLNRTQAATAAELLFENPEFNPKCVIEI